MSSRDLESERKSYRAQLDQALQEDEDPLAAYDTFIKWTLSNYSGDLIAHSGLVELLEEVTRTFRDDSAYKGDLRYLKTWSMFANCVEYPALVFEYLLKQGIGTVYAQVYEDFALALEQIGRRADAEQAYQLGVQRRARPAERLKKRYAEFQARPFPSTLPSKSPLSNPDLWKDASPETQALRKDPFKNYNPKPKLLSYAPPKSTPQYTNTLLDPNHDRYAHIRNPAPLAPGKRPEKLRFNLSLLFTSEGEEYSIQEARARSMGLLGKKWGPPPEAQTRQVKVGFDETGARNTRNHTKKNTTSSWGGGAEPTVTLATKEALADVFGMYNSPEKSMRYGVAAGSKHAPVQKINFERTVNPVTPLPAPAFRASNSRDENDLDKTPFRPYVDPGVERKENNTPAPAKFKPFVDEQTPRPPAVTPDPNRRVLSVKETVPPVPRSNENARPPPPKSNENAVPSRSNENPPAPRPKTPTNSVFRPLSEDRRPPTVFTPAAPGESRAFSRKDIFVDPPASSSSSSENASAAPAPFKVFSRPTPAAAGSSSSSSNVFSIRPDTPGHPPPPAVFKPFVDPDARQPFVPVRSRTPLSSIPTQSESEDDPEELVQAQHPISANFTETDEDYYDTSTDQSSDFDDGPIAIMPIQASTTPTTSEEDSVLYDEQGIEGYQDQQPPLGGRLGQFQVMTPITERTYEFTSTSMKGQATPSEAYGRPVFRREDPVEVAEQLAAELRREEQEEEEGWEQVDGEEEDVQNLEERTGTLSFSDAINVASKFKTSNPCNPFDPPIMSTLLSLIPADPAFRDLRPQEAGLLDTLQKFAKRKTRRTSGNTSSRSLSEPEYVEVTLGDERTYKVTDKLGEGGFGAVFEAIDVYTLNEKRQERGTDHDDDDDDDDFEDEDEDGGIPRVALKVVKPRNLWEFHVLRRIHSTLPTQLRNSIITPQLLYAYADESYLVLELRSQGTLLNIVNGASQAGITQHGACLDELLVMFFAIELMRLLEGLHRAGFIHGDVKIDNCLVRMEDVPGPASAWDSTYSPTGDKGWKYKGIKMIDFGRTIDTRLFPVNQQFVGDWPTDARDCLELREGRPWTFQPDYYGLAGIIYCMLYGKYIEASSVTLAPGSSDGRPRYKLAAPFKRYWQVDLWTRLFDLLLNPTLVRLGGSLPLCDEMGALRGEMETWLQANCNRVSNSLKGLLKKVGLSLLGGKDARR
ncbi:unnamed protein product [Somion occarium]|uniref:Uncharacterized protein n=1 Tax=Somion occarium TaxID=3059160 RepID=A0ABP1E8R8_9APHY